MSSEADALRHVALGLPDDQRADLAAELLASLDSETDDPAVVRSLWGQELERRAHRVLSGETDGEDWDSIRRRLADELSS